jgi:hypothetical protein
MSPNAGGIGEGGGSCGVSANELSSAHGVQINFGDQTPYLTYVLKGPCSEKISNILHKWIVPRSNIQRTFAGF